jgi:HEAT repeat protein
MRYLVSLLFLIACSSKSASQPATRDAASPKTPAPAPAVSCAGPARPDLTAARVGVMISGDDDYPIAEMRALGPAVMPALQELAGSSNKNTYTRSRAISLLGDLGCRDTVKVVEAALKERDPMIRLPATTSIGKLVADPTPVLLTMLADQDTGVVKYAIKSLGSLGDARAVAPLEKLRTTAASTPNEWLGQYATTALAEIKKRHP